MGRPRWDVNTSITHIVTVCMINHSRAETYLAVNCEAVGLNLCICKPALLQQVRAQGQDTELKSGVGFQFSHQGLKL